MDITTLDILCSMSSNLIVLRNKLRGKAPSNLRWYENKNTITILKSYHLHFSPMWQLACYMYYSKQKRLKRHSRRKHQVLEKLSTRKWHFLDDTVVYLS